jgi:acyl dehydratase
MPAFDALRLGDELPPLVKGPITRQHLVEWCAAENDYYPLHYDERLAQGMGLAGTPLQGTLKYALMSRLVENWLAGSGRLCSIDAQYRGADFEGDTLTVRAHVAGLEPAQRRVKLALRVENQRGERNTRGEAVVQL